MLLMLDNYDSFTYNVVQYLGELGADVKVVRNDELSVAEIEALNPERIVVSPGPCTPNEAGVSLELIRHFAGKLPILGVCLGHQAIGQAFGGRVVRATHIMHGKTSAIRHLGDGVFAGLPDPFVATRYHSLAAVRPTVDEAVLEITAETEDGVVMGLAHRTAPLWGVQFHPESVLTEGGYRMLGNWLESVGLSGAAERGGRLSPLVRQD